MSDFKERLEQERRRFAMSGDSFQDLERRRDRKRRNRRLASGLVGLLIAAAGVGGGLYAFRSTGSTHVIDSPTPSVGPTTPAPSPTPTTTQSPVPPVTEGVSLPSGPIQFIDDQHGWMVDSEGQILATSDGGHTWDVQLSGPSNIVAVDMLSDGLHGWGVGEGGLIETSDGGAHWVTWSNQSLSSVQFLTAETGWGVEVRSGDPVGTLAKTEDGGRTWTQQDPQVESVCFADANIGWAAGPSEGGISLFRSSDGGSTWTETGIGWPGGDVVGYRATVRCGGEDAWILATGDAGAGHIAYAVFRTANGGSEVDPVLQDAFTHPLGQGGGIPEASNPQPGPLAALDGTHARVITWCPPCGGDVPYVSVERTDDGGATWTDPTIVDANHPGEPLGISFLDQDRGWVLLRDHQTNTLVVLETSDGGQTWSEP
jgi:photosystem II stability/assembly factor-like uncharacterized protein